MTLVMWMVMVMMMVTLFTECDVPVPGIPVPGNCSLFLMVSEPVSEKFGTEKKSRNRYRKKFGTEKSLGIGIE